MRDTVVKVVAGVITLPLFLWAFFSVAGGFHRVDGWIWLGLLFVGHAISALWLRHRNPEVLRHRMRIGRGTPGWDRALLALFGVAFLGSIFVAAADRDSTLPDGFRVLGAGLFLSALWILTRAMTVNPHFEKTARVQRDRSHRVIETGPYRFVRHPGYLALIVGWIPAPALLLGSAWALLPAGVAAATLVLRTALEDRMLRRGLDGYEDYAARVRFRLLPGIW